jgi:dihydrolipoamide dehydrogenase
VSGKSYDAIVIGGGPGGYVAAIRLGQLGLKPLVVEREYMGGVCLNWGCIPSKALIAAAGLVERIRHAETMGIHTSGLRVDVAEMQRWKGGIVKKLTTGVKGLVKSNGGEVVMGAARLVSAREVRVEKSDGAIETFAADKGIVIAAGATPSHVPGFEPDGKRLITAREAIALTEAPSTLVVIGGGVIGMELGMVYQKLGSKVIVVEMLSQLLGTVDRDLAQVVQKRFEELGGEVLLEAKAKRQRATGERTVVEVEHGGATRAIECDKVLVAVGFRPNSAGLGLDEVGVATDARGHVIVDAELRTSVRGVFAIGDVTGAPYLAHRAMTQGERAAEVIAGRKSAFDVRAMPAAIFTDPEVATVGLSETEAKARGVAVKVGKFPFAASGRAMAIDETRGFVKTIVDAKSDQVLGVGIVGPEASELVAEATLAVEMCAYAEDLTLTVHTHPTLSESVNESFRHALKEAIHVLNKA